MNIQKRLSLIVEARNYSEKMQKGSAFITDFKAMRLIKQLAEEMQSLLGENLKLEEELKSIKAFSKNKKEQDK
tara:strand:+ start:1625 stop:1843 length:219 start_codon:yes stop_codon:yes gene_type:complete